MSNEQDLRLQAPAQGWAKKQPLLNMRLTTVRSLLTKNSPQINEVCSMLIPAKSWLICNLMKSQFSNKQDLREQQRSCKAAFKSLTTSCQTTLSRENWEIATISLQLQLWPSSLREYKAALSQPSLIKKASIGSDYTTMEF